MRLLWMCFAFPVYPFVEIPRTDRSFPFHSLSPFLMLLAFVRTCVPLCVCVGFAHGRMGMGSSLHRMHITPHLRHSSIIIIWATTLNNL